MYKKIQGYKDLIFHDICLDFKIDNLFNHSLFALFLFCSGWYDN